MFNHDITVRASLFYNSITYVGCINSLSRNAHAIDLLLRHSRSFKVIKVGTIDVKNISLQIKNIKKTCFLNFYKKTLKKTFIKNIKLTRNIFNINSKNLPL